MSLDLARIAAIRTRAEHATQGPWRSMKRGNCQMEDGLLAGISEVEGLPRPWSPVWVGWQNAKNYFKTFLRDADAEFIAQAREDIPYLLDQIAQQAQEIQALQERLIFALPPPVPGADQ